MSITLTIPERLTRYFWLSLLWGTLLALPYLSIFLYLILSRSSSGLLQLASGLLEWLLICLPLVVVSALVGNLLRRPFMPALLRRAEAATTLPARYGWLAGGTVLLFIASVLFCTVVFIAFFFRLSLPQTDLLWPITRTFFLLSSPWLLTAPIAACWVCRDWLRPKV